MILLLFFPVIQWKFKVLPKGSLVGVETPMVDQLSFNYSDWFAGRYQKKIEGLFAKQNGFRSFFIRLDNQINLSLFGESKSYNNAIVVGRDNWLFERDYIKDMNNENQVDIGVIEPQISEMKKLQNLLGSRGIYFLFLISPSKATVYGEYVPKSYIRESLVQDTINYTNVKRLVTEYGINCLDAHEFFIREKQSAPHDLFVQSGTHWSYYGAAMFSTALVSKIQSASGIPIGSLTCESIRVDHLPLGTDRDLSSLMNVFSMKSLFGETAHPTVKAHFQGKTIRPDVLIVGGSFMHTINELVCDNLFGKRDFYFYYQRNIPDTPDRDGEKIPANRQLKDAILSKQIIIVETNEIFLHNIGFGFIANAIKALSPGNVLNSSKTDNIPATAPSSGLTQTQVSQLYVSIFGRASEGQGNAYWRNQITMVRAADAMLATKTAKNYFGNRLKKNRMFIEFIYKNTLGKTRAQDPKGLKYWTRQLAEKKSKGEVVVSLINALVSPDHRGSTAQDQFLNKVAISNYVADKIEVCPDGYDLSAFIGFISGVTHESSTVVTAKADVNKFLTQALDNREKK
ncbi:MAG: DUF4214 domain-containing protein [Desulfobacterium sp.]|nr:DUF4214 domain-containing protein [Desulfobacterium sp.]